MADSRLLKGGIAAVMGGAKLFPAGGGGLNPPVNLRIGEGPDGTVIVDWEDNPGNANSALFYTVSRPGQADVQVNAPTTSYQDGRLPIPTGTIYTVTLTNVDGTSAGVSIEWEGMPTATPLFTVALQASLTPEIAAGSPTPTYSRNDSVATFTDFEGIVRRVSTNEPRFLGARRVFNELGAASSEDFTVGWQTNGASTIDGPDTISFSAAGGDNVRQTTGTMDTTGPVYTVSCEARADSNGKFRFMFGSTVSPDITITSEWVRYAATSDNITAARMAFRNGSDAQARTIQIRNILLEDVTGQANQNPSEYVSVGVESAPFHGANVDGVEYFTTTNGNTVDANGVVTEAQGTPLTATDYYNDADGPYGYVSEGASTNVLKWSEDYTNAYWTKSFSVVQTDGTTAPDGSQASKINDDSSGGTGGVQLLSPGDVTLTEGQAACLSVYAKAGSIDWIRIYGNSFGINGSCYFDLVNGVTGTQSNTLDAGIVPLGDGWYRCWLTMDVAADNIGNYRVALAGADGDTALVRNGTHFVYFWGSMVEISSFPTSYIKTEAATVQRLADSLTYDDVGNIQDAAGTAFAQTYLIWPINPVPGDAALIYRDANGRILYRQNGGDANLIQTRANADISSAFVDLQNNLSSLASTWSAANNRLIAYGNGIPDPTPANYSGTIGTDLLGIGNRPSDGARAWHGTIRKVQIFDEEADATQIGTLPI